MRGANRLRKEHDSRSESGYPTLPVSVICPNSRLHQITADSDRAESSRTTFFGNRNSICRLSLSRSSSATAIHSLRATKLFVEYEASAHKKPHPVDTHLIYFRPARSGGRQALRGFV